MQSTRPVLSAEKRLVILKDADGCFYNARVLLYLLHLLNDFTPNLNSSSDFTSFISYCFTHRAANIRQFLDDIVISNDYADLEEAIEIACRHYGNKAAVDTAVRQLLCILQDTQIELYDHILYLANQAFIKRIIQRVTDEKIDGITLMIGSIRQNPILDYFNAHKNTCGSFFADLPALQKIINREAGRPICEFDGYTLEDVLERMPIGHTAQHALSFQKNRHYHTTPPMIKRTYEESKFMLLHNGVHYIGKKYWRSLTAGSLIVEFYDDRMDLLKPLINTFSAHPDLLPKALTFNFYHYEGEGSAGELQASIKATGSLDLNHENHTLALQRLVEKNYPASLNLLAILNIAEYKEQRKNSHGKLLIVLLDHVAPSTLEKVCQHFTTKKFQRIIFMISPDHLRNHYRSVCAHYQELDALTKQINARFNKTVASIDPTLLTDVIYGLKPGITLRRMKEQQKAEQFAFSFQQLLFSAKTSVPYYMHKFLPNMIDHPHMPSALSAEKARAKFIMHLLEAYKNAYHNEGLELFWRDKHYFNEQITVFTHPENHDPQRVLAP